jgi:predicted metal-dependent hydrolase
LFFDSLSVSIPESERFIASTAKIARLTLSDDTQKRAADTLIHEEEAHTRVHAAYNELLRRQGYQIARFEAFEKKLSHFFEQRSLKTRLALCLCGEFFTAVMGKHLFQNRICEEEGIDERMRALWTWHSLEELDHRNTAFDLYLHQGGGYLRRVLVMIVMTILYFVTHLACFFALLKQDHVSLTSETRKDGRSFLFGKKGFYRAVITSWFAFFKPGFHPLKDIHLETGLAPELHHFHVEEHFIHLVEG